MPLNLQRQSHRFALFFTACIIAIIVLNYSSSFIIRHLPMIAPAIFPIMTLFLIVFHIMVAVFVLMKYLCDKSRLCLTGIAFAFAGSGLMMLGSLSSYPEWTVCQTTRPINYNDAMIFFLFRNVMMAVLFNAAYVLFIFRNRNIHSLVIHTLILAALLAFCALMLTLAWLYSSNSPLLSIDLIDNDSLLFTRQWRAGAGIAVIVLWCFTLIFTLWATRLCELFWYSGAVLCACYIVILGMLLTNDYGAGYNWYEARLFETMATLFLLLTLLYDIFRLYRESNSKFLDSYQNSIRDPLTRLYNRSYFYDTLNALLPTLSETRPVSLIIGDLDHFKRINDKYGHLQGDKVIQFVAEVLQNSVRQNDIAARIGGEEFALLLSNTAAGNAAAIAERIRLAIGQRLETGNDARLPEPITISLGVYTATNSNTSGEECVQRADEAMYRAKQAGRNQVVVWR